MVIGFKLNFSGSVCKPSTMICRPTCTRSCSVIQDIPAWVETLWCSLIQSYRGGNNNNLMQFAPSKSCSRSLDCKHNFRGAGKKIDGNCDPHHLFLPPPTLFQPPPRSSSRPPVPVVLASWFSDVFRFSCNFPLNWREPASRRRRRLIPDYFVGG